MEYRRGRKELKWGQGMRQASWRGEVERPPLGTPSRCPVVHTASHPPLPLLRHQHQLIVPTADPHCPHPPPGTRLHEWATHVEHLWRHGGAACSTRVGGEGGRSATIWRPLDTGSDSNRNKGQTSRTAAWLKQHPDIAAGQRHRQQKCGRAQQQCQGRPADPQKSLAAELLTVQRASQLSGSSPDRTVEPPAPTEQHPQPSSHLLLPGPHSSCPLSPSPLPGTLPATTKKGQGWGRNVRVVCMCKVHTPHWKPGGQTGRQFGRASAHGPA